jgi:hypothetical protein
MQHRLIFLAGLQNACRPAFVLSEQDQIVRRHYPGYAGRQPLRAYDYRSITSQQPLFDVTSIML